MLILSEWLQTYKINKLNTEKSIVHKPINKRLKRYTSVALPDNEFGN